MPVRGDNPVRQAIFTLSLDFELIWGSVHHMGPERFSAACEMERSSVIDRLLELFVKYEVPATWCIVGHLFIDHCQCLDGTKHPEIIPPSRDWLQHDPCGNEETNPNFYGRSLLRKIQSCPVPQEIGCHSFSHIMFPECSRETARSEIAECVRLASEMGIEMKSFAFPRNRVCHLDVLEEYGFTHYRGPGKNERWENGRSDLLRRLGHLFDILFATEPQPVVPERKNALWNIPGSTIFFPKHGIRRYIPMSFRVRRARKGLNAAVRDRGIFHLWFHPTNMADEIESMFSGLDRILAYASQLRRNGRIEFLPMGAISTSSAEVLDNLTSSLESHFKHEYIGQ